jgi:hypothetical protein
MSPRSREAGNSSCTFLPQGITKTGTERPRIITIHIQIICLQTVHKEGNKWHRSPRSRKTTHINNFTRLVPYYYRVCRVRAIRVFYSSTAIQHTREFLYLKVRTLCRRAVLICCGMPSSSSALGFSPLFFFLLCGHLKSFFLKQKFCLL